ncbi:MAG TPA: SLATT domain-containing protein [Chloroflexota bacterium]|nr:SLATT domain-containing protein [Chloroflexota bacterium]
MESTTETSRPAILEKAWMHHAELDTNADRLSKRHLKLRQWVLILGIVATILAIVTDAYGSSFPVSGQAVLKVLLILTPLIGSMIAAFTSRELGDGRWLSMRAGAEEIKKEIYIYRTVLSHHPDRHKWLSNRLAFIQRQIFKASGRRLDTAPYTGVLPLYFSPDNPNSDSGFNDLTAEEYITYRLQEQLSWHEGRIVRLSKAKRNLTIAILLAGVAGSLLAALGGSFAVWVALTAGLTASLTGWEELRNRDKTILNYSKVKLELAIIRDYWYSLSPEEQTDSEFFKMVLAAENVMFAQNGEWLRSMQEALAGVEDEDKKLVEEMVALSVTSHAELQQKLLTESQAVFAQAAEQLSAVATDAAATVSGMVTAVSSEAMALNQTMAESVDAAAAEAAAARLALEASRDTAMQEAAAWRETAQESATATAAQSAAVRQSAAAAVATETAAWSETAQDAVDTAVAQSTAARDAAAAEAAAWEQTSQAAVDTAVAQSAAARQSMAESVDAAAAEVEATRLAVEASRDAALAEAAAVREAATTAVAAETDAWGDTAQDAVDTAVAQSAAAREAAETAIAAETTAWSETAKDTIDTAVAQSTAAREAAAAEAAAWAETAQEAVDRAVAESAALRQQAGEQIKFAVTFTPVSTAIEELGTAVQEKWTEVTYEAIPDIKYPVQFMPKQTNGPENGEPAAPSDTAVDEAVDRLLEEGVQVADDTIRQALAKAAQEENA